MKLVLTGLSQEFQLENIGQHVSNSLVFTDEETGETHRIPVSDETISAIIQIVSLENEQVPPEEPEQEEEEPPPSPPPRKKTVAIPPMRRTAPTSEDSVPPL